MKYAKPQIVLIGTANSVIQGGKSLAGAFDSIQSTPQHPVYNVTAMAYEADE